MPCTNICLCVAATPLQSWHLVVAGRLGGAWESQQEKESGFQTQDLRQLLSLDKQGEVVLPLAGICSAPDTWSGFTFSLSQTLHSTCAEPSPSMCVQHLTAPTLGLWLRGLGSAKKRSFLAQPVAPQVNTWTCSKPANPECPWGENFAFWFILIWRRRIFHKPTVTYTISGPTSGEYKCTCTNFSTELPQESN